MNAPGFWEIIFLAGLALVIFGPDKLPGMASKTGKALGRVRAEAASTLDELKRAAEYEELRSVAGEFKATSADVRQTLAAGGAAASLRRGAVRADPAPFDPEAT